MNLGELQKAVHVAKDKKNEFGGYNYRTAEGILAAIKAALPEGGSITVTDDLREVAGQIFVQADATVDFGDGQSHTAKGFALHPLTKKGMDPSQITGSASSYARKYALSGLVALDDGSVDPDAAKEPYQPDLTAKHETDRNRLIAAINNLGDVQSVEKLYAQSNFKAAIQGIPEAMQADVQKAYTDKLAALA